MHNRAVFMASTVVIFLAVGALWLTNDAIFRFESQFQLAVNAPWIWSSFIAICCRSQTEHLLAIYGNVNI